MQNLSARNPLGIIALFISLIYGISALLLGVSIDKLSVTNQERLVWFVVIFPCAVLAAFLWLVAKHHKKLYGPGDYRTDEGFLSAGGDPALVGQKYRDEARPELDAAEIDPIQNDAPDPVADVDPGAPNAHVQQPAPEVEAPPTSELPSPISVTYPGSGSHSRAPTRSSSPAEFYLLEGLVLQELQGQFNAPLRRDIEVSTGGHRYTIDGLIEESSGKTVVEIKFVRNSPTMKRRIREGLAQLDYLVASLGKPSGENIQGLLVLIADDVEAIRTMQKLIEMDSVFTTSRHPIRFFSRPELLSKYGIAIS